MNAINSTISRLHQIGETCVTKSDVNPLGKLKKNFLQ